MSRIAVKVLSLGVSNRASIYSGLGKAGGEPDAIRSVREIRDAERLVVPGVGSFGAGMERLRIDGSDRALRARIEDGSPTLLVCLGMQLLAESSEESPGIDGLGVLPVRAVRFGGGLTVPQMGWNEVRLAPGGKNAGAGDAVLAEGQAYFANSYCLREAPDTGTTAWAEYDRPFLAAWRKGATVACQFHPELSGAWGIDWLRRWLRADSVAPC
ncbi:MAG: imidazole glycerol phosphate synthase subunit HisH [Gemmatimonadetes bacterium]|nr:imidazole glycerol phosphate synthase subunit HisH [Gemmatimonadota bacterium]